MSNARGEFASSHSRQICKKRIANPTADIGKCIPIKKKVGSRSVEASQKLKGIQEGSRIYPEFFPAVLARASSLWINSVLR